MVINPEENTHGYPEVLIDLLDKSRIEVPVFRPSENTISLGGEPTPEEDVRLFRETERKRHVGQPPEYGMSGGSFADIITPKDLTDAFKRYWTAAQPHGHETEFGDGH